MSLLHKNLLSSLIAGMIVPVALSACRTPPATPVERKKASVVETSDKVESLERQLRERDKRIEELESQLEALKLIDQEHEKQRKPIRPPTTLEPTQ
jgi:TolA-binding protein